MTIDQETDRCADCGHYRINHAAGGGECQIACACVLFTERVQPPAPIDQAEAVRLACLQFEEAIRAYEQHGVLTPLLDAKNAIIDAVRQSEAQTITRLTAENNQLKRELVLSRDAHDIERAEKAEAQLTALREENERLTRHAKVDDIAFDSMNHFAVDAEMKLADALAEVQRLKAWQASVLSGVAIVRERDDLLAQLTAQSARLAQLRQGVQHLHDEAQEEAAGINSDVFALERKSCYENVLELFAALSGDPA